MLTAGLMNFMLVLDAWDIGRGTQGLIPMPSHFLLMVFYALLVSVFFAVLWRRERSEQARLFLQIFLGMVGGGLLVAWLMYPFPFGPPAPLL